jgi:fatty acid desaturase
MTPLPAPPIFPMAEARKIVGDLFTPSPLVYWADFLLNATAGWTAFVLVVHAIVFSLAQFLFLTVAFFCLYRAVIFIHELTHLKSGTFMVFRVAWHLLAGFPLLVPSFSYTGVHADHHAPKLYGTREDGEYFAFVLAGPMRILLWPGTMLLAPVVFAVRSLVLTPISYVIPSLRTILWERLSSLALDPDWKRPPPRARDGSWWRLQEFMTFAYAATLAALLVTDRLPLRMLAVWFTVAAFILVTNALRTLAATHCYRNPGDHVLEFAEQVLDSVTVPGNPITTGLWAPVGLRYHATHHLFPGLPYHNLGKAHRRLMKALPDDSPYRLTLRRSLLDGLTRVWKDANAARAGRIAGATSAQES